MRTPHNTAATSPTAAPSVPATSKPQSSLHGANKESWEKILHQSLLNTSYPQHSKPRSWSFARKKQAAYYLKLCQATKLKRKPCWKFQFVKIVAFDNWSVFHLQLKVQLTRSKNIHSLHNEIFYYSSIQVLISMNSFVFLFKMPFLITLADTTQ